MNCKHILWSAALSLVFAATVSAQYPPNMMPSPMGPPPGGFMGAPGMAGAPGMYMVPPAMALPPNYMGMAGAVQPAAYLDDSAAGAVQPVAVFGGEAAEPEGKGCKGGCATDCCCCVTGGWYHRFDFWGEYLYLRPRDAEVVYAVGNGAPLNVLPVQVTPLAMLDLDFQPGWRAGFNFVLNECTKIGASYTMFEGQTSSALATTAPTVIFAAAQHPGFFMATDSFVMANATYDHTYDMVDVEFRQLFAYNDFYQAGYVFGVRGVQHEQQMTAIYTGMVTRTVQTDIDFSGIGLRAGLEWERFIACQWNLYAKAYGALIPGEFTADFDQNTALGGVEVDTAWKAGRIVTIWDLELGTGWTSKCGNYHASLGYVFSAWTNLVQTDEWIRGVQTNNFIDMSSTTTYDGLVGRVEVRF